MASKIAFTGERMIPELNKGSTFYYEHLNRYLFSLQYVKDKKVLDLACGVGYGSKLLSTKAKSVTGIDKSKSAIRYAKEKYNSTNIKYIESDVFGLNNSNEKYDVIVCFEFLEHLKEHKKLLNLIKERLNKDGLLIISTPNKKNYKTINKFHLKELDFTEFSTLLNKHFENAIILEQYFWFGNFIIKSVNDKKKKNWIDNDFKKMNAKVPDVLDDSSQYLIAVCSSGNIKDLLEHTIATQSVDGLEVSFGIEQLFSRIMNKDLEDEAVRKELTNIKTSKFYRFWRFYRRCLEAVIKIYE